MIEDGQRSRAYSEVTSLSEIEIVIRELGRTGKWIGQFAEYSFESVGCDPAWAVGVRMAASFVRDVLLKEAEVQELHLLAGLRPGDEPPMPAVAEPAPASGEKSAA